MKRLINIISLSGIIAILLIAFSVTYLKAQTISVTEISGFVHDKITRLVNAKVSVKGTNISTTTNEIGYFKLIVPDTADSLVVSLPGYDTQKITIDANNKADLNIILYHKTIQLLANQIPCCYGNIVSSRIPHFYACSAKKNKQVTNWAWFNIWTK